LTDLYSLYGGDGDNEWGWMGLIAALARVEKGLSAVETGTSGGAGSRRLRSPDLGCPFMRNRRWKMAIATRVLGNVGR
jgi:hypothetical protein